MPISHDAEIVAEKVIDGGSPCFAEATTLTLEEAREKARPTVLDAAVQATFPKGNLYIDLRTEFGMLYDDQFFDDLYLAERLPVEVAPGAWHWSW